MSRNDRPRLCVPMLKVEGAVLPFELPADEAPPPHIVKILSAMEAGTPSPKISRRKMFRLTYPDPGGEESLLNASCNRRRSESVTEKAKEILLGSPSD